MATKQQWYVGVSSNNRQTFRYPKGHTPSGNGYLYVIGPFKTHRGAQYMRDFGGNGNPHLQHVDDAERYAKLENYPSR